MAPRCYQVCKAHCSSKGKYYYGTQYGSECWCGEEGTDYNKYGSATCDRPCSGDPTTICGGSYAMTVYLTGDGKQLLLQDIYL